MKKLYFPICIGLLAFASCVPQRLMEETKSKLSNCETELANKKKSSQECESSLAELKAKITKTDKEMAGLQRDTAIMGSNLRLLQSKYDKLNLVNDQLLDKYNRMLVG